MASRSGLVWKVQLAVFVFVGIDAGRRVTSDLGSLGTPGGLLDLALLVLSVGAGAYVAWHRQPISTLFGGRDRDAAGEPDGDTPEGGDTDR
jgi:hypothetical protein